MLAHRKFNSWLGSSTATSPYKLRLTENSIYGKFDVTISQLSIDNWRPQKLPLQSVFDCIFVLLFYRTQLPVKLRNRVRMNAVEPSDMFEYISRHFKAYNFNNMESIQECPFPIQNMSIPIHESVGGLIDDKPVLCGGLTRKKRQIS